MKDASGQTVGWFHFRADPLVAKMAGVLTKDEAPRMAVNFARLPELLGKGPMGVEPRQRCDTLTVRNKSIVFYVSHLMSGTGAPGSSSGEGRWHRSRRPFALGPPERGRGHDWIERQPDELSRPEAIRQPLVYGLTMIGGPLTSQ